MIWATVSSRSCFCWLYTSPSLAAKNIINRISIFIIWSCPCVKSSLGLLEKECCPWPVTSLDKTVSLCPASFCTPGPNLPVIPGIFWLPTFAFLIPYDEKDIFFFFLMLVLQGIVGLHRTSNLQLLCHQWLGHRLGLLW